MESRCQQEDEEAPVAKCKHWILQNISKLLLVLHIPYFDTSPHLRKLPYFYELEEYFFLKATTSLKSLHVQSLSFSYALSVLPIKIPLDFSNLNVLSALLLFQLPRILSIYNEKLPYNTPHKATQSKQVM